jgi:hypothetical protein
MRWDVEFHEDFYQEFLEFPEIVKTEILAKAELLGLLGPNLKRPHADTLNGSTYANMKELRFNASDGVWRVAFAFDPKRSAILLTAGDKVGQSQKRFYQQLIEVADRRFLNHLAKVKENPKQ